MIFAAIITIMAFGMDQVYPRPYVLKLFDQSNPEPECKTDDQC